MSMRKFNSRGLRRLAEEITRELAEVYEITESDQEDFTTSLVRQWITYGGNATLFLEEQQINFFLGQTPLGKPRVQPEPGRPGWVNQLTQDWKISSEQIPDILNLLNRGQSAEVTNAVGLPLRVWVNPKERSKGVESLVKEPLPPGWKRDYHKIAADILKDQLGYEVDEVEMEALTCSVAKQWRENEGHACLFLEKDQLVFQFIEKGDGNCSVNARRQNATLEPLLCSLGFAPEIVPEVIARINLCQEIEFRDRQGVLSRLRHDPRAGRIQVRSLEPVRSEVGAKAAPIFCPKCNAVLKLWRHGEAQQLCPGCGQAISIKTA
jgi:hypothetical protein